MEKDIEKKLSDLCDIWNPLIGALKAEVSNGLYEVNSCELERCTNALHYLAETERNILEACYYKTVVEAMEAEAPAEMPAAEPALLGYNNHRYKNGRYAPKGSGMIMGYSHNMMEYPYIDGYLHDPNFKDNIRMGYDETAGRHGEAYNGYVRAKRSYTQTKSGSDKEHMNQYINDSLGESINMIREMWHDADPDLRKRFKPALTSLVSELNV